MTILVTGATGRIGSAVVDHLVAEGAAVRALTRAPETARFPSGVEAVRGKPLSVEREGAINFIGVALLLLLAVLVTVGDVQRLVGG